MMLAVTSTTNDKAVDSVQVSEQVFGREVFNEALVHQVVTALMAGLRQGSKAQKSRGEVSGGGRKPWRQKGTGRARAGSIRSPIWRGGGTTFAASPRSFSQKINKKMYRGALQSVLSELVRQERLKIVDSISVDQPKTKALVAKLKDLGVQKALIVTDFFDENLYLAARNVPNIFVIDAESLSPLDCVRYDHIVMTVGALKKVEEVVA